MSSIKRRGQVLAHPARTEIVGVHPRAGRALIEHHQLLALFEAPQARREGADVHRLGGDVEQVIEHPADLGVEHPDQTAADRDFQPHQLLDSEHEGVLLVHRRDVVEAVEVADVLGVGPWPRSAFRCPGAAGRCAGPMRSTSSPSSSSTSRNTPCAAGCCGPKLMLNLRTGVSADDLGGELSLAHGAFSGDSRPALTSSPARIAPASIAASSIKL